MTRRLRVPATIMVPVTFISSCVVLGLLFFNNMYSSPWPSHSTNKTDAEKAPSKIVKRSAGRTAETFTYLKECVVAKPTKYDIQKLCRHQECSTVHCVRSLGCDKKTSATSKTTCFSKVCSKYDLEYTVDGTSQKKERQSLKGLSSIVDTVLRKKGSPEDIQVQCADENSYLYHEVMSIEATQDTSEICQQSETVNVLPSDRIGSNKYNDSIPNVHLLYFRFLSRWESFVKLPRLNAYIEHKRKDASWNIVSFDKMQSESLVLEENLLSLLGDFRALVNTTNNKNVSLQDPDLIQMALSNGRCVIFNAIACHRSDIYDKILEITSTKENERNCKMQLDQHISQRQIKEYSNRTFCGSDDSEIDLADALFIHDQLDFASSSIDAKVFSISIINVADLPSAYTLDTSITELVRRILSQQSAALILVSDVGDPIFARLDSSVSLRSQTFNPFLHVFLPRSENTRDNRRQTQSLNLKIKDDNSQLLSVSDVLSLTKTFLLSAEEEIGDEDLEFRINNRSLEDEESRHRESTMCPAEKIKGPVECLCQGHHARFPNDSIQVAFANFVVGKLNNKLLDMASLNRVNLKKLSHESSEFHEKAKRLIVKHPRCDRLVGLFFFNVQHVLWRNTTFILMTLNLQLSTKRNSNVINLEAEVEYSTVNNYNTTFSVNILNPRKISIDKISQPDGHHIIQKLIHLLCHEPNDLEGNNTIPEKRLRYFLNERHFGVKAKEKSIHHPCLYTATTAYKDSAVVEAANICDDRSYTLTISAELLNIFSFTKFPVQVTLGPGDVKYVTSLVKLAYGVGKAAYKLNITYSLAMLKSFDSRDND